MIFILIYLSDSERVCDTSYQTLQCFRFTDQVNEKILQMGKICPPEEGIIDMRILTSWDRLAVLL